MKKIIILSGILVLTLSGCASTTPPSNYIQANTVNEPINLVKPPSIRRGYQLMDGNDPVLERAFNHYISTGRAENIITDGFVQFAYNKGQQPLVLTSPFQQTVISLEVNERFTNVTTGDPNRWSYSAAISGSGNTRQYHILVKPSLPNIATNMVITTDKRIYNLRLMSKQNGKLTRNISFWYPEEMVATANQEILKSRDESIVAQVPDVSLNNLNFDYNLSTNGFFRSLPAWKPIRVFDDGTHTYIEFSKLMAHRDLPVLFIQNQGNKQLVNYRVKSSYFVVDKIFKQAVLIMGLGQQQTGVIITNNRYN